MAIPLKTHFKRSRKKMDSDIREGKRRQKRNRGRERRDKMMNLMN